MRERGEEHEIAELRARLAARESEMASKERQLERYAADLRETFKQERRRSQELRDSYAATVRALSNAVEARDAYTHKHAERVAGYAILLAHELGMADADDPAVEFGFLLHDIGKLAIPDAILFKRGPLDDVERTTMEQHPVIGWEIIREIDFLAAAKPIVRNHHERWDGTGYPDRLGGTDIPAAARVFAVADALDALTSTRPYRTASSFAAAREIILAAAGSHFDPAVIEAYARLKEDRLMTIRGDTA